MSSASNRIKSKYESCSKKIEQMYEEFSAIRKSCTPTKSIKESILKKSHGQRRSP